MNQKIINLKILREIFLEIKFIFRKLNITDVTSLTLPCELKSKTKGFNNFFQQKVKDFNIRAVMKNVCKEFTIIH